MTDPVKSQALAALDPQSLISQAISSGTPVETIENLVDLAIRMREVQAKEAYSAALATFQAECPDIVKDRKASIRTRGGGAYEYKYAALDGVMDVVQPVASAHGLSITWKTRTDGESAYAKCVIRHALGHVEEGDEIGIPIEKTTEGGSGASPAQRVGIAISYAKRYAALSGLGLAPTETTDGSAPKVEDQHSRPATEGELLISENHQNRLWATLRKSGWGETKEEQETAMHDLLAARGLNHLRDLPASALEDFAGTIKAGPKK